MARFFLLILVLTATNSSFAINHSSVSSLEQEWRRTDDVLLNEEAVKEIYQATHGQLIWLDLNASIAFESLLEVVTIADLSDHLSARLIELKEARMANQAQRYDTLATDTLLSYISYIEQTKENGKAWYFGARVPKQLPPASQEMLAELIDAAMQNQLTHFINQQLAFSTQQQAASTQLGHLLKSQFIYQEYWQNETKRKGDDLENKAALIERLAIVGINTDNISLDTQLYDESTEQAVIEFQRIHGLKPDGIIGPNTLRWLNTSIEERARILALNIERLRLWDLEPDNSMVVNVPDFRLRYGTKTQTYFDTKVIVGRKSRKTPLIDTRMDSVIFNPTWNVPRKIMVDDIIPAVKRDANYLEQHNYKIIEKWGSEQTIDPSQLDWTQITPKRFPYHLRQNAGATNALGLYKFNTPNRNAIYLHDTPSKHLFNFESRAFSSGCIRVQHADQLADLLVDLHSKTRRDAPFIIEGRQSVDNFTINLRKQIPVHIIYQTAWIEAGQVQYRSDVYQYDRLNRSRSFEEKFTKLLQLDKLLSNQ